MRIFLTWVSVIPQAFGLKTRFFLLHPVDVVSIQGFEAQGCQSSGFSTSKKFCMKTKRKTAEIPVTECSLIPADTGSELPEVDVVSDYACAFLY